MANNSTNYEIAQEISARLGTEPIPPESIHDMAFEIYQELGGEEESFDDVYSILTETLPLARSSGGSYTAGENISIEDGEISALGYEYDEDYESFAVGWGNIVYGDNAFVNGEYCYAFADKSHAEGYSCETGNMADYSHAEGFETETKNLGEHAEGFYNCSHLDSVIYNPEVNPNAGNTLHSIGVGSYEFNRKNAFEVMQNGDIYVLGVGGYQGTDTKVQDNTIKTLQEYIASLEARIQALGG